MRWSKLRQLTEELFAPQLDLQIHCTSFRSENGPPIGRYWLVLNGETVWEAPKNLSRELAAGRSSDVAPQITELLREYLHTPREELLTRRFAADVWGLTEILRLADRRIGRRVLEKVPDAGLSLAAQLVLKERLKKKEGLDKTG